jgi:hypothetical protein
MKFTVFWVVTQRKVIGIIYRSHLQGSSSSETSLPNHFTLRNNPEDGILHFKRGGTDSPKIQKGRFMLHEWEREKIRAIYRTENLEGRHHIGDD